MIYIKKSKEGRGYYTNVKSTTKEGKEIHSFFDIGFKKGTEPLGAEYNGELYLVDSQGGKRKAFFNCYLKNGVPTVGLMLLDVEYPEEPPLVRMVKEERKEEPKPTTLSIETEELPFY